jgi:hypothetical protein
MRQSIEEHFHRCKNWFSKSGGFWYNSAFNLPTVAICTMVGVTVGISWPSQGDMPRGFAWYAMADFGGFYYDTASNLLAYHAVTVTQPLREVPTLINGLDAES